jgi:hypothetical protein
MEEANFTKNVCFSLRPMRTLEKKNKQLLQWSLLRPREDLFILC